MKDFPFEIGLLLLFTVLAVRSFWIALLCIYLHWWAPALNWADSFSFQLAQQCHQHLFTLHLHSYWLNLHLRLHYISIYLHSARTELLILLLLNWLSNFISVDIWSIDMWNIWRCIWWWFNRSKPRWGIQRICNSWSARQDNNLTKDYNATHTTHTHTWCKMVLAYIG